MQASNDSPSSPPEQAKPVNRWVLAGAAVIFLVGGLLLGKYLWQQPDMTDQVNQFLTAIDNQDYAAAYNMAGDAYRSESLPNVARNLAAMHEYLGRHLTVVQQDFDTITKPSLGEVGTGDYDVTFEKSREVVPLKVSFMRTDEGWKIIGMKVYANIPVPPAPATQPATSQSQPATAPATAPTTQSQPATRPETRPATMPAMP